MMRYDAAKLVVYGSPADAVYLLMAPDRGSTLISETDTAWTWDGGGIVQVVPKELYVQLDADRIGRLEYDEFYPLGRIPEGDVLYMKVEAYMTSGLFAVEYR